MSALDWREDCSESLRTSFTILENQQLCFIESLSKRSDILFFNIVLDKTIIGVCGFVNLSIVNRIGEISLILNPEFKCKGYGILAVKLLLNYGFSHIGLRNIFGESYTCSHSHGFWKKIIKENHVYNVLLPERKFFNHHFHDGLYFNFTGIIQ